MGAEVIAMACIYRCKKHGDHTGPECQQCLVEAGRRVLKSKPRRSAKTVTADTRYKVTLVEDDERTGYKAGMTFDPKGVYFHKGNCILVGSRGADTVVRLKFKASKVKVEIVV